MAILLLPVLITSGFLFYGATKYIFPHLYTDDGFAAVPTRLLLAAAFIVCGMCFLLNFFPGKLVSWLIMAGGSAGALAWKIRPKRPAAKGGSPWISAIPFLLLGSAVLVWRLWSAWTIGRLTPFEGNWSHDDLWYNFVADWLSRHSLRDPVQNDPNFPFFAAAGVDIGTLPRIGAESLTVFVSAISDTAITQAYVVTFAIGSIFLIYASALGLLADREWRRYDLWASVVIIAIAPAYLFIFANSNYSTCFGLAFLGAAYWFLHRALVDWGDQTAAPAAGIFIGALISCYPELLTIALPAALTLLGHVTVTRKRAGWRRGVTCLAVVGLIATLMAPRSVWTMLTVFLTTTTAVMQSSSESYLNIIIKNMSWHSFPLEIFLLEPDYIAPSDRFIGYLDGSKALVASAILFFSLSLVPRVIWSAASGLIVGGSLVLVAMWMRGYGYGVMKAIEFLALPLTMMVGAGVGCGLFRRAR
jgi:hypothetical protein